MVVPVREVANIQFSYCSANTLWPSMTHLPSDVEIDDIRERSPLSSKPSSRNLSVSSSTSLRPYYKYIKLNNDLPNINLWEPIDSSQLSYKNNTRNEKLVSKVANSNSIKNSQHSTYESSALKTTSKP